MTASDATSAAVTGERSFLMCRSTEENGLASVSAAARETISVSASRYCPACCGVIPAVTACRILLPVLGGRGGAVYHARKLAP